MAKRKSFQVESPRIVPADQGGRHWRWLIALVGLVAWTWVVFQYGLDHAARGIQAPEADETALLKRIAELEQERDRLLSATVPATLGQPQGTEVRQAGSQDTQAERTEPDAISGHSDGDPSQHEEQAAPAETLPPDAAPTQATDNPEPTSLAALELTLRDLGLVKAAGENSFAYKFVLARAEKGTDKVVGAVSVHAVDGGADAPQSATNAKANRLASKAHKLGFRHFQELDGQLDLPAEASPEALLIEITLDAPQAGTFSQSYPWSQAAE
jgi:hypothetical protein